MGQNLPNANEVVYPNMLVYSVNVAILARGSQYCYGDSERAHRGEICGPLTPGKRNILPRTFLAFGQSEPMDD